jgi:hypothetical protein
VDLLPQCQQGWDGTALFVLFRSGGSVRGRCGAYLEFADMSVPSLQAWDRSREKELRLVRREGLRFSASSY